MTRTFLKHAARLGAVALCAAALSTAPMHAQGGRAPMTPEQQKAQFDAMVTAVGLTDAQQTKIKAIQADSTKKMADLRASGGDPMEMRPKMTAINTDQTTAIKAVLTDDAQRKKYDDYIATTRPAGGRGGMGGGGGMGAGGGMGGPPPQN